MNIACDFPSDPSYFKLPPLHEFNCDFKLAAGAATPPTPSTPTINSKYIDGLNDFEPEEFSLNPPKTKSLSLQSISDKENKHFSSNTPKTPKIKKRGRGRPKGSKNKKKKSKCKPRTLQLPNLKHIPKTVTQFELRLSPPYYTPPPLTPTPQPSFWEPTYIHSPFQIDSFPSYYQYTQQQSPNPLLIDHRNQVYSPPNYSHLPPPTQPIPIRYCQLLESPNINRGKRAYYNMNTNDDQYNNANHPNKRRKITHSEDIYATYPNQNNHLNVPGAVQQFQSGNMNGSEMNNNNMSISGAESENEPIISPHKRAINHAIEEEEKHNNVTKRALFKEKLSNININANERNMNITPATAPNETNIAANLPNIEQKPGEHAHPHTQAQNNNNLELANGGHCGNDGAMIMDAVSAPILNNNSNLDWFGADENINTLNANNHPFEMNMFPMGMGDDMKDMGLPSFMMNDIIPNQPDMMDMDIISNSNTNNGIIHRVKQENNILPPPITNNNYPPTNYHNNLPRFSISSSPPQQSSMFMDQINANSNNNIYAPNDYTYGQNNLIRSRSLQNGPNALRPANLPTLRRSSSTTASNNSNLGVEYVTTKTAKSEKNKSDASATNAAAAASRSHVLTPFDYPLSNELITSKKGISHDNDGFNENSAPNSSHFNFLWWYPEVKFCELDPQLIPIP